MILTMIMIMMAVMMTMLMMKFVFNLVFFSKGLPISLMELHMWAAYFF